MGKKKFATFVLFISAPKPYYKVVLRANLRSTESFLMSILAQLTGSGPRWVVA